jgi:hypothetical protein
VVGASVELLKEQDMPTKLLRTAKILGLIFIGFVLGTGFGFREGFFASYVIEAPAKGVISMSNLKALEKQNYTPIKLFLNLDIDQGIYYHTVTEDQWWFPFFEMGLIGSSYSGNTEYVTRLAKYRQIYPAPNEDPTMFDQVPKGKEEYADQYHELAIAHRDRTARIKSAIEKYSAR